MSVEMQELCADLGINEEDVRNDFYAAEELLECAELPLYLD